MTPTPLQSTRPSRTRLPAIGALPAPEAAPEPLSGRALEQMRALVDVARNHAPGTVGWCHVAVPGYLDVLRAKGPGYGSRDFDFRAEPTLEVPAQFGEWLDTPGMLERTGLRKLDVTSPYDAPPGSLVVVAAGSPGTTPNEWWVRGMHGKSPHPAWAAHPSWPGDLSIAAGNGKFINDHTTQQYGGREGWETARRNGTARLIGVYAPHWPVGTNS